MASIRVAPLLAAVALGSCRAPATGLVDHQKFMGTWQIMTIKNLKTGEVDSIFKRRLLWTQYTRSQWTYVYTDTGRTGPTREAQAKMSPSQRRASNYQKMFNEAGQWRFWGSGGTYWLDGDTMRYTNVISIEPYMVQGGGVEHVIYVNDTAYAYQSLPDKDGVVREYTHRRLDTGGPLDRDGSDTAQAVLIMGNWQVMSQRSGKTGKLETVAQKRVNWFHITKNHWTYVWMTKDRKNVTPDEMAALPASQQANERYAKIWNDQGQPVFWASGGTYHIENGKFIVEPRAQSIEPWMVGVSGVEPIVRLDRNTYTYASPPDSAGGVSQTEHRRIDW